MSPRHVVILLALGLAALPAAADWKSSLGKFAEQAKEIKAAVVVPEEDEERALGQDVAATLLGASKPVANPKLQQYVNRVGLWVALQGSRPNLAWRFAVLDNDNVNAFATPGGYVFITRGLLAQLQSEAELAAVLGHEIAHVEKKHHLKAMKKDAGIKLLGRGVGHVAGSAGSAEDRERLSQVAGVAKGLYARGLDKEDEYDADRTGTILAARAGYDPYGMVQVLQTLDGVNADASKFALLFKTHPKPAERLARLDQALGSRLDSVGQRPVVAERFLASMRK